MEIDYDNIQGCINATAEKLIDKPDELKKYMSDKTEKQKEMARSHLRMVKRLKRG